MLQNQEGDGALAGWREPHLRYLFVLVSIMLAVPSMVVALATSGFYYRHSSYFWDAVSEQKFTVRGQSAEVLFVGDSSLLHGVSPQRLQQLTGLNVYNLGVSMPTFIVDHEQLVDHYLAHNATPRLLVLYLSAATRVTPPYVSPPSWYEGETMLLRYGQLRKAFDFFAAHTQEISRFVTLAGHHLLLLDWSGKSYRTLESDLDKSHGYVAPLGQSVLDMDNCPISGAPIRPDREFLAQIRNDFAARGIPVVVYLAPVPDCEPSFARIASSYAGLIDNTAYTLPRSYFLRDGWRQHLLSTGAVENSAVVAEFLNRHRAAQALARSSP